MCAVIPSATPPPPSFLSAPFLSAVIPFPPEDSHPHLPPLPCPTPHPVGYPVLAPHAGANFRASSLDPSIQLELSLHTRQEKGASLVLLRVLQLSSRACRRCAEREGRMGYLRKVCVRVCVCVCVVGGIVPKPTLFHHTIVPW